MSILEGIDLAKSFRGGDGGRITVLDGLDFAVERGEMVAIVGASGAGKSTLLHLLGGLDYPDRGMVRIDGQELVRAPESSETRGDGRQSGPRSLARARDEALSSHRNRSVGFVFQFHHLLREFSALENVMMPLRIGGWDLEKAEHRARELLDRVGLGERMLHRPAELSGGEQQRAAVARALVASPPVLLADEPSGNLDHANSERLHSLLVELAADFHIAMVIVTHNRSLARRARRTLLLEDGRLTAANTAEVVP
ncbi:MAG TPA: ABC transporter ATP-binding protein [Gemmatimonadaceae bacterium]|jgi:lipoprotein-releasing system ATP-binding protein